MTWGYLDQTKGRNVLGPICEDVIADMGDGSGSRGLIESGCCMLYVGRRNEWIGGGIDRYGCVHKVMTRS